MAGEGEIFSLVIAIGVVFDAVGKLLLSVLICCVGFLGLMLLQWSWHGIGARSTVSVDFASGGRQWPLFCLKQINVSNVMIHSLIPIGEPWIAPVKKLIYVN